jgi:hypothetical protein
MTAHPARTRRTGAVALLVAVVASTLALAAAPASAAPVSAASGSITWGVKASFRSYIVSPGAAGSVTVTEGATQASSNGVFTFPADSGSVDGSAAAIDTRGKVQFLGHDGILDVTLSDIRVNIDGTSGTLVVDAVSRAYSPGASTPGAPVTYDDVTFATLDLTAVTPTSTATGYSAVAIPAKLTSAGVPVLAGFYAANTALDPVTVAMDLETAPTCTPGTPAVSSATASSVTVGLKNGTCPFGTKFQVAAYAGTSGTAAKTQDTAAGATSAVITGLNAGTVYRFTASAVTSAGTGPQSAASTVAAPPFATLDNLTNRQALDFRLRAATAAERSAWATQLGNGTLTPVGAVNQAVDYPEWAKQSPMIRLFQAYFLRLPDIGGLNYWTGKSRAGTRINTISANFAGSTEFTRRYGKLSNKAFVELVYQNVLGRPGDAGGIKSWTGKLDAKTKNRGEVMVGFSESNEYKNKTRALTDVVNVYTGMLRRTPTKAENDQWEPLLKAGTARTELVAALFGSAAYDARVS